MNDPTTHRMLLRSFGMLIGVALLLIGCRRQDEASPAEPATIPTLETAGMDPAVVQIIRQGQALVRKSPDKGEPWGILGSIFLAHDFRPESRECFEMAERLEPREPRWPYLKAIALLHSDADAGLASLRIAVELTGDAPSAPKLRLAELLTERGDLKEAEDLVRQVLDLEPENPRALLNLGRIHLARGDLEASHQALERSARLLPDVRATRVLLTTVSKRLGIADPGASLQPPFHDLTSSYHWPDQFHDEAGGLRRGSGADIDRARLMLEKGKSADALELLEKVTATYPELEQAWWMLGLASQQEGLDSGADLAFHKAVELAPKSFDARTRYGLFLLFRKEDYLEAERQLEAARDLQPRNALAIFNLAVCKSKQGDLTAAISGLEEALRLNPAHTNTHLALAEALWRSGDGQQARFHLRKALELSPNDPSAEALSRHFEITSPGTP